MPRIHVQPAADRDLDDQAGYLAVEAGLETAMRFYDAASTTFEHIARMPGIGEKRESPNPRLIGLRVWRIEGFKNHLIFYLTSDEGISIVRVLHGARDIDGILSGEADIEGDADEQTH
jgi:toxin ParE1/3/4